MNETQTRICVVEDNTQLLDALSMMIQFTEGFELVGAFKNSEEAIEKIPSLMPDAVLMDINLPGISGISCVNVLKNAHPSILFLMCTSHEDTDKIFASLQAGASGYILKTEGPSKIMNALQEMIEGGSPMSASIARKVVQSFNSFTQDNKVITALTDREIEVLDYLSKGLLNKEVADKMNISTGTVRKHAQHIYEKLQVNTRVEAVNIYMKRV